MSRPRYSVATLKRQLKNVQARATPIKLREPNSPLLKAYEYVIESMRSEIERRDKKP